jgi:hypothetical protein
MPRYQNLAGEKLYDASADLEQCEFDVSVIAHIAGVEFEDISNVSIDEIWEGLRRSFKHSEKTTDNSGLAAFNMLRKRHFMLILYVRSLYRKMHMARWCVQNGK